MLEADDYFAKLRRELGFERVDELMQIQSILDQWYPGIVRAKQLHQGILTLVTASSATANDLRMRQVELLHLIGKIDLRLRIQITR